ARRGFGSPLPEQAPDARYQADRRASRPMAGSKARWAARPLEGGLPRGGKGRQARAQLRVRGEDLLQRAIIEPVENDIGVRHAPVVAREQLASQELAGAQRRHVPGRAVRPEVNGDFAGIDQIQAVVGILRSQDMLASTEL